MQAVSREEYCKANKVELRKARNLEIVTCIYRLSIISLMYFVTGSSQAMKTAWIEDILSLIPSVMFFVSYYFIQKSTNKYYPYGFYRVGSISFLTGAIALLIVGGYLLVESCITLIEEDHPTIGMKEFLSIDMWLGFWMLIVLVWGTIPPVILGHFKIKFAKKLNDKTLYTAAKMNRADWLTGVGAMIGVIGIGFGIWWIDAVTAIFISLDIVRDGYIQTKEAVTSLVNRAPRNLDGSNSNLPKLIIQTLENEDWIKEAEIRIYEHGPLLFGEGFFVPHDENLSCNKMTEAINKIHKLDKNIRSFALTIKNKNNL